MLSWIRKVLQPAEFVVDKPAGHEVEHEAAFGAASVYFIHTVPTSKRINLGKAVKWFLDSELAVAAAWPSDEAIRVPPSLARIESEISRLRRNKVWIDGVQGWGSLLRNILLHPLVSVRVLRLARQSRRRQVDTDVDAKPFEESLEESEKVLLRAQSVSSVEQGIDGDLFWSERSEEDAYVRLLLRSTRHTMRIREKDHRVTLEPRVLLHRGGTVQITVGVHLPAACPSTEIIEASFPGGGLFHDSRMQHPIQAAMDAAGFTLISHRGDERQGALSIGSSGPVISAIAERADDHQALSLVFGLPKLISLAVIPELRGHGIGAQLLQLLNELIPQLGCLGVFGDVEDTPELVRFYQHHAYRVLRRKAKFNVWPVAGGHIVHKPTPPARGPFIQAEPGMRVMFVTSRRENETVLALRDLNPI